MVKLVKVNKYFNRRKRNEIHVIKDTTLELEDKGFVAILGNSGSGKTTLLNTIGGLDKINKGKIYINGKKITKVPRGHIDKVRTLSIGYIFQNYNLISHLTVFENVALALKMIGIKNKKEIEKRVMYVLDVLGISKYRNRPSYMLSGGERQKVGIARAIVKNPSIIIADEPTGNLDSKNSLEIMNILKSISKEKLVILVTHEKELAEFYASRIIKIVDGKVESDEKNDLEKELDYRLYSNIYLKDLPNHQTLKKDNMTVDYYSDSKEPLNVTLVLRNGNIYIEADPKIEVVDSNSSVELIPDHYHKLSKDACEPELFCKDILEDTRKHRYSSIYNIFTMLGEGFRKLTTYTPLKKILLLGFFVSAMFILYALSSIQGVQQVRDENFITSDPDYLTATMYPISVEDYLKFEALEGIDYMFPGNSSIPLTFIYDNYYQTTNSNEMLTATLSNVGKIAKEQLIEGRLPETSHEIVLDRLVLDRMNRNQNAKQARLYKLKGLLRADGTNRL